jgi:hypothetical protein
MIAYSAIAIAMRHPRTIWARVLRRFIAGGIVLSLIAIEKAFLDLIEALMESPSLYFSEVSLVDP